MIQRIFLEAYECEMLFAEWEDYEWDQWPSKKGKILKWGLLLIDSTDFGNFESSNLAFWCLGNEIDGWEQAAKAACTHLILCPITHIFDHTLT